MFAVVCLLEWKHCSHAGRWEIKGGNVGQKQQTCFLRSSIISSNRKLVYLPLTFNLSTVGEIKLQMKCKFNRWFDKFRKFYFFFSEVCLRFRHGQMVAKDLFVVSISTLDCSNSVSLAAIEVNRNRKKTNERKLELNLCSFLSKQTKLSGRKEKHTRRFLVRLHFVTQKIPQYGFKKLFRSLLRRTFHKSSSSSYHKN